MTTKVIYQCQKCGQTLEIAEDKKPPFRRCTKGGRCDWKEPYYFN